MESETETVIVDKKHRREQPEYVLDVIRQAARAGCLPARSYSTAATCFLTARSCMTTRGKSPPTRVYEDYRGQNGVSFPWQIEISRPKEEYDITLTMVKLELNRPLADDKFVLEQPPGAEVVHLDKAGTGAASGPSNNR